MEQSTIALLIMGGILVMYIIPKIPLSVTTVAGMIAMAAVGIIPFSTAFSGFGNSAVLLVAGMMIIGEACFAAGVAEKMGGVLYRCVGGNEKKFVLMIFLAAGALSIFLNGALVVALLMTIIDSIAGESGGAITRKNTYFPLGVAATLGNNLTTISGTSTITALAIYYDAGYERVNLFAPLFINLPALIAVIVLYMLFGYKLQAKIFDFEEIPAGDECERKKMDQDDKPVWKMVLTCAVLIGVTIALICGADYGAATLVGAAIVIVTGCVTEKAAYRAVSWTTIILVAGAIGISAGFSESGAGQVVADFAIHLFGNVAKSPFGMCVIIFVLGSLISNVMSDNAAAAILVPIALVVAQEQGVNPLPYVLAAASGVKDAISTPLAVATMTMVQPVGYRFKHYILMGGMINVLMLIGGCIMIGLLYF